MVAQELGITISWQQMKFEGMLTSVASGRVDAAAGCLSDVPAREEQATFVDYTYADVGFIVTAENPHGITEDPLSVCGATVAVQIGTTFGDHADQYSKYCTDNGKKPLTQQTFPSAAEAITSLQTGRIDANISSYGAGAYQSLQTKDAISVVAPPVLPDEYLVKAFPRVYVGVAVAKENTDLQQALLAALEKVTATDAYQEVLDRWKVSRFSLTEPGLNLATERPLNS